MKKADFKTDGFINRGEQIDNSIFFMLDCNELTYESLQYRPRRLERAAVNCFLSAYNGYHARVIRAALNELDATGKIDADATVYDEHVLNY